VNLLALANLLQLAAVATGCALAWKRPSYRAVAALLLLVFVADWARLGLKTYILSTAPRPFHGAARAAFHIEQALFLTWPTGVAALAQWEFLRHRPWNVLLAYSAVIASLVLAYPGLRQSSLAQAYLALHITAFAYAFICTVRGLSKANPGIEQSAVVFSTFISATALLGPYTGQDWISRWNFAQLANVLLYSVLVYLQGGSLWTHSHSSSA